MMQHYYFSHHNVNDGIYVSSSDDYSLEKGYGFFTEEVRKKDASYRIVEINTGFDVWDWYTGQTLSVIKDNDLGVYMDSDKQIPLSFKANVNENGTYLVTITITTGEKEATNLFIFSESRRLMKYKHSLSANSTYTYQFTVDVSDIIARGYTSPVKNTTLDLSIFGSNIFLSELSIQSVHVPVLYIAGDSTVTDQSSCYPYDSLNSYCGWGQMLPLYLNTKVAVSNHAHSGLTTESFTSEGHFSIIENRIQAGDFMFLQFAHNDQKLAHLKAEQGYQHNLETYITFCKDKGATPVLVTPLCRNSWKGNDGTYHDLLEDYARVCHTLSEKYKIPLLDLHQKSYDFITSHGLEDSKRYFYPGDFTHSNDFGAYIFAKFISEEMNTYDCLSDFVLPYEESFDTAFIPPKEIYKVEPPEGYVYSNVDLTVPVNYTDLDQCKDSSSIADITKLASLGLLVQHSSTFAPLNKLTRIDALELVTKIANFFPTNVYNDYFVDVVGHEWYAGLVECAYSNGIISDSCITEHHFYPMKEVSYYELLLFCVNGYASRRSLSTKSNSFSTEANYVIAAAKEFGLYDSLIDLNRILTKEEGTVICKKLYDRINVH